MARKQIKAPQGWQKYLNETVDILTTYGKIGSAWRSELRSQASQDDAGQERAAREEIAQIAGQNNDLAARLNYQKSKGALPNLELNHIQAVERQLQVLKDNNSPYPDHGVEALYRFSNFDPFKRSLYFGRPLDLGQFERFRRIFHTPEYAVLLCHKSHKLCSSLKVTDVRWKQRVEVRGEQPNKFGVFTFSMVQRVGGHSDGIWFCESLTTETAPDIHT